MPQLIETLELVLPMATLGLIGALFGARPSRTPRAPGDPLPTLRTRVRALEAERGELARLCRLTLEFVDRLHSVDRLRDIPPIALDFMIELFDPEEALVLIRRQPAVADTDREHQLIVAASIGRLVRRGTVVEIGRGPLGRAASRSLLLDRAPAPETPSELRGFHPELAVPMTAGRETVGVLTLCAPTHRPFLGVRLLQFVASAAAKTFKTATTLNRVRSEADLDSLTGILNKGALTQLLDEFAGEALQLGRPLSVFLFDIDHFKNYNDTNGHPAGDDCLRLVSRLVAERVRADDAFGRWGGEEFLLLLPGRDAREASFVAEEIRRRIAEFPLPHGDRQPLGRVSVSGGVACLPDHARDGQALTAAADEALYAAKHAGRDRVEVARENGSRDTPEELPDLPAEEDDLEEISGIGPRFSQRLQALGIFSFRQIAELDWRGMMRLAESLGTNPERIVREGWLAQARKLHRARHGEEI